jgi:hypothetical protein
MNQRERFLTVGLLALIILGGGAFLFHFLFWQPLDSLKSRIANVRRDLEAKEKERDTLEKERQRIVRIDPRLQDWRKFSLPEGGGRTPDEVKRKILDVQVDYEKFLSKLLRNNGFAPTSLTISPKAPDSKSSPTLPGRGPIYTRLGFAVTGQAPFDAVVRALEEFHKTGLLHEVRILSLLRPETRRQGSREGDLEVKMDVEALLVSGAEKREDLLPDSTKTPKPQLLATGRKYEDLIARNIFLGRSASSQLTEDPQEVLSTVKLTTLSNSGRRWEAFLFEKDKGPKETRLRQTTGFNEFVIRDRYNNVVLKAKVVRLDDREVLFQADGKYYRLHLGEDLSTAMKTPLKDEEAKSLGLVAAAP